MATAQRLARAFVFNPTNSNNVELAEEYGITLETDDLTFADGTTPTKKATMDLSGLPVGTTVLNPVTGLGQRRPIVSTAAAVFATPITPTVANSGSVYSLKILTGADFTLPIITAANLGMFLSFRVHLAPTSNSYRITTGQATDLVVGSIVMIDKDQAEGSTEALQQIFRPNGTDDNVITIGSADATTGNLPGGWFELEATALLEWTVRGILVGDGALATVFS